MLVAYGRCDCECDCDMTGEEKRSAPGDERGTCNCEAWYWRFARGVSGSVGCVSLGTAKNGERVPSG
jgi:hypothetical protein